MASQLRTAKDELRVIANCLTGIQESDLTTAERKIVNTLIDLKILRFDIYDQVQLVNKD